MNLYDLLYGLGLSISAPVWLARPKTRRKVLEALAGRMGHGLPSVAGPRQGLGILLHAVSVGELNATRALVEALRRRFVGARFLITTTTSTGWERARQLYGDAPDVTLVRYPLDFTSAVTRVLQGFAPDVVVLMELEVWPNFMSICARRHIGVVLVNARLTEPSFRRYRLAGPLSRRMFAQLGAVGAQEGGYARRLVELGVPSQRVHVTGTMKFDTAQVADHVAGDAQLALELGLRPAEPLWVCGSTGPGEETLVLQTYRQLLGAHPTLRLAIIPRHPQRFDEVADLIQSSRFALIRRSQTKAVAKDTDQGKPSIGAHASRRPKDNLLRAATVRERILNRSPLPDGRGSFIHRSSSATCDCPEPSVDAKAQPVVILGDTMGELRKFYSLASVVFVGRSLVDLGPRQHGSDMIEPAALGKCVAVGPHTGNFAEVVRALQQADALACVANQTALRDALEHWLSHPDQAAAMGQRARAVVTQQCGATERNVKLIEKLLKQG